MLGRLGLVLRVAMVVLVCFLMVLATPFMLVVGLVEWLLIGDSYCWNSLDWWITWGL